MTRNPLLLGLAALFCLSVSAQNVKIKGIGHSNRYDDGEQMVSTYLGWNSELQKAIFIVDNGIYAMTWDGQAVTTPEKEPPVVAQEVKGDSEKEIWANNFNMMYGNSGAAYVNGRLVTVMSRDESSTTDDELFAVRRWDAATGNLVSTVYRPKSATLESAGMCYNPVDGRVYGLFYLTENQLPTSITEDPDYFTDEDDTDTGREGLDAGYALCSVDLSTMTVTPITPGLYYYNFITFAINSEGRAFALTSGGSNGYIDENGKMRDIDNNLSGAQLYEFNLETGLMKMKEVARTDDDGEQYTDYIPLVNGTGYCSQYKRQAACFAKSTPDKMYWVGYVNSGKGINEWGSWSSLSDKEWRTNGKYDTALYEVDVNTGEATMLAKIPNRWAFSCLWVDGDDASDDAVGDPFNPDNTIPADGSFIVIQHAENGSIWQQVETGRQYTYFLEPAEGWTLHSVTFNGNELDVEGGYVTTPAVNAQYSRLVVTFEKAGMSDISAASDGQQVRVLGTAGGIHIANATVGDKLHIYDIDGRLVDTQVMTTRQADVALQPRQVYIVKIGSKVVKVRL
jgi:hypothetical protein